MAGTFRDRQPDAVDVRRARRRSRAAMRAASLLFHDDDPNSSVSVVSFAPASGRDAQHHRERKVRRQLARRLSDDGARGAAAGAVRRARRARIRDRLRNRRHGGELAQLEESQSVTVAEISSGVIEAAPLFDFANHAVSRHPKVRIVHSDAYRALRQEPAELRRDRLGAEQPVGDRASRCSSRASFSAEARDHLTPRGVFCQWFHLYETTDESIELVLRDLRQRLRSRRGLDRQPRRLVAVGIPRRGRRRSISSVSRRALEQADFCAGSRDSASATCRRCSSTRRFRSASRRRPRSRARSIRSTTRGSASKPAAASSWEAAARSVHGLRRAGGDRQRQLALRRFLATSDGTFPTRRGGDRSARAPAAAGLRRARGRLGERAAELRALPAARRELRSTGAAVPAAWLLSSAKGFHRPRERIPAGDRARVDAAVHGALCARGALRPRGLLDSGNAVGSIRRASSSASPG